MASTYLYRDTDATANSGSTSKFTFSAWIKRNKLGAEQGIIMQRRIAHVSQNRARFAFSNTDKLYFEVKDSSSNDDSYFVTNRKFRDCNAWYHIVLSYDTTQSTASNRIKLYVNGVQETSFYENNTAAQDFAILFSSLSRTILGISTNNSNADYMFDGCMSHVHFTYGYAYDASAFGSVDSATGEWKINTSPSVTYGSQGFFVLKDGNSVTDQSGQSNNLTVGSGTLTKTEDCPSNVFATLNPLSNPLSEQTLTNGNTSVNGDGNASQSFMASTLEASSGKYYFEAKLLNYSGASRPVIGIGENKNSFQGTIQNAGNNYAVHVLESDYFQSNGASTVSLSTSPTSNDIYMIAYDLDNLKMYFGKNGSWFNSGDPSAGTNGLTIQASGSYAVVTAPNDNGTDVTRNNDWNFNFGNGYFGTTAVSSAGTNASGNGIFEYDVPTGYTALSTKGLNL